MNFIPSWKITVENIINYYCIKKYNQVISKIIFTIVIRNSQKNIFDRSYTLETNFIYAVNINIIIFQLS
jgi:hypothetical protein